MSDVVGEGPRVGIDESCVSWAIYWISHHLQVSVDEIESLGGAESSIVPPHAAAVNEAAIYTVTSPETSVIHVRSSHTGSCKGKSQD